MNTTPTCVRCGAPRLRGVVHRCRVDGTLRWMLEADAGVDRVFQVLRGLGRPLVVGGVVRDGLLRESGRVVPVVAEQDVDVELHTDTAAGAVADRLRDVGAVVVPAGTRFAVLKVVVGDRQLDVAVTARGTDGDLAFRAAAARRDFTMNAVAWDPVDGVLLDAFGGIEDSVAGVLRHTSEAFADDPLRVLRAVRFVARHGFVVHEATIALARSLSDRFSEIATERVWHEIRQIAAGDHVSAALDVLHRTDWERHFPELAAIRDVPQDPRWHPEGPVHVHAGLAGDAAARSCSANGIRGEDRLVIVLAAVLHDLGKAGDGTQVEQENGRVRIRSIGHERSGAVAARAVLRRLGSPRRTADRVALLVREHMVAHSTNGVPPSVPAARRLLRRLGGSLDTAEAWALVCDADTRGRGSASAGSPATEWLRVMRATVAAGRVAPLVSGRDLIDLGLDPGPVFHDVLTAAARAQDDGVFDDVAGARRWLAGYVAAADAE